jgi:putative hydroxymethylpyrimidine transport system substrate-binding protein
MKRFFYIFILLSLASVCYGAKPEKLVILLDWFANPNHAPLFVAQQQGYFKEYGLDVELLGPADPSDPPKLVAAGKADIAITYQPQFMEQVDQGLPLIRIGTLIDKPLACLVVLKKGPIQSIQDLKGKRIGYSSE